jgi:ribonucleoside-diphosphate reductase alpha chain
MLKHVVKRDESLEDFTIDKIKSAVAKAGLSSTAIDVVAEAAVRELDRNVASVEEIQDVVEKSLMSQGYPEIAKKYILYREERRKLREARRKPSKSMMSDYIHAAKYSRFNPVSGRRETWKESSARNMLMHTKRWPHLESEIVEAFQLVYDKKILPSMRSLQFGGKAIESLNARGYNCSFSLVDRPRFFQEMFYLLLAGCGTGYSVQYCHVDKLPPLVDSIDRTFVSWHTVEDSIEGWANALGVLVGSYFEGSNGAGIYVDYDYSKIRLQGVPLKTSGGLAPGHVPLKELLENVRKILNGALGRKLKPIECHDINCHVASGVLAGGIRRSSLIALFSPEDAEMMQCKTGDWITSNGQRRLANNSAVLIRGNHEQNKRIFTNIFRCVKEFGEPGFIFLVHPDHGYNPCSEIGLNPVEPKTGKTGWAFCNLTEINGSEIHSESEFIKAAIMAARIGTYQAAYTDFAYLGAITEAIARREALLGVSITGIMDSPITQDPVFQTRAAKAAVAENIRVAALLGINPAYRVTTVKPSGTASLVLGCVGSGIHPHHARRYLRRVTANHTEPVFQYFKSINPHMCVKSVYNDVDWVIEFPIQAPDVAVIRNDLTAIQMLDKVFSTYENWILPGTANWTSSYGLTHNVSCTLSVRPEEWDLVENYVWENRHRMVSMSFLPWSGDKIYPQAPREEVTTKADEARWNEILENYTPVDYREMKENSDTTSPQSVSACEGPACEVVWGIG